MDLSKPLAYRMRPKNLDEYVGQEVTIIVAVQNLNLKASDSHWRGLPIQVIAE